MRRRIHRCRALSMLVLTVAAGACSDHGSGNTVTVTSASPTRVSVLTHHNDNARTGANLAETVLTPDVVRSQFGYLFALPVDGQMYAQPLYVADLDVGTGEKHDVVIVATEHDSVYAFDANDPRPPLWQVSLGTSATLSCFDEMILVPELGITGTPVIDRTTN